MIKNVKNRLYEIVFEADTPTGKYFDLFLFLAILISVFVVMLESIERIRDNYAITLRTIEWGFTLLFTAEYIVRIWIVTYKTKYIFSFYGIIDLLAILPTYLGIILPGTSHSLAIIRSMRLLRVFRILKLPRYVNESQKLMRALISSKQKIGVFFFFVIILVVILGTIMYLVEDKESGFTSIPQSIYWAVVTLTTVGYGDIAPATDLGRFIASLVMIIGYAIIAIPTGIITTEIYRHRDKKEITTIVCPNCLKEGHDNDASHCKYCGEEIRKHLI
jgi:voltage-gated potassium channel